MRLQRALGATGGVVLALQLLHRRSRGQTRRHAAVVAELIDKGHDQEAMWHLQCFDFPWDIETALSLALFRTYAVPEISVVLAATGHFVHEPQKRYDDTELVLATIAKQGLDDGDGRVALQRMNAMHGAYDIQPELMKYVLSTFILEPVRWNTKFGWRPLTAAEKQSSLTYYLELGRHMGLRDLPTDYPAWDAFNVAFERDHFRYHPANRVIADATTKVLLDLNVPRPLHPLGRLTVRAMIDEPLLLAAFGLQPAPRIIVTAVRVALRWRAVLQRHLLPERRTPHDVTAIKRPTYPGGFDVAALGSFPTPTDRERVSQAVSALRS